MCGIICEICYSNSSVLKDNQLLERIKNRGPNCVSVNEIILDNGIKVIFCAAVLWMQGSELTSQPIENEYGFFLYNGDIFDESWDASINDTQVIVKKLSRAKNDPEDIVKELKTLKGPFSIIYYDKVNHNLYFTRDRIGRNSLLVHKNESSLVFSSVLGRKYDCIEVPSTYIYMLNIKTKELMSMSWSETFEIINEIDMIEWMSSVQEQQNLPDEKFTFRYDDKLNIFENEILIHFIENLGRETKCKLDLLEQLLNNNEISDTVSKIIQLLEQSVKIRVLRQPKMCQKCIQIKNFNCNHCSVGVLFSGGLDCTILAFLADKYLPKDQSIDLINVAFEKGNSNNYDGPDRLTGQQSLEELRRLCPLRQWVFREVNVPRAKLEKYQSEIIGDLIYPRQTILDESLGSALWFAAQGENCQDTSFCRVLLLGSGADELFGGYTRHRNAYKRYGWDGLNKELLLDWKRISFRNLARDNRVICDHGRQPRLPYLDEDLTEFLLQLKPWLKCFPNDNLGLGIGDKLMLRLVAFKYGLTGVAILPKRALQFGSRIANKKEKGSDISKTFLVS
ncbi:asparagine synthetase domain-containing protein CG17486 isoform X2 [Achroia grisella]|uniref:asparagine synthetase domain-containing protein CG17486 isoform X2 n=1 Tax=Achroia grisella TaxID=688607 RepID=UPI0027D2ECF3|nr:asparagine synthetase domain-containing protein CG17486 isoform X2 [Achroia grisella]